MGENLPAVQLGEMAAADVGIATGVAAGEFHTCAFSNSRSGQFVGSVKCWGANGSGQLGLGDANNRGDDPGEMNLLPNVELGGDFVAKAVVAGDYHTCALSVTGSVKCWGSGAAGQLGTGAKSAKGNMPRQMGDALWPIDLHKSVPASAIAAGGQHTCAILTGGSVKCWGSNDKGQLGHGDIKYRGDDENEMGANLPVTNLGTDAMDEDQPATAVAIVAGTQHTCALLKDGRVKCWGFNEMGQLGLGDVLARGDEMDEMGDALPAVELGTK
ncbi:MAG: hypothetical protein EXR75_01460 [Myxococcales bacterium]|nr:hypothetical protein [Myxococcales bacterium]